MPLRPLLDNPGLLDTLEVAGVLADRRWTYSYRGRKNQIDHVLVSRVLENKVIAAGVDRSGIAEIAKLTGGAEQPMAGITSWRNRRLRPRRDLGGIGHRLRLVL